jgi:hypothetical protein
MKTKLGILLSLLLIGLGIYFFKENKAQKGEFHLQAIQFDFPYHPEWDHNLLTKERDDIHTILSQKFTYLGKGARLLSFLSEDESYVLKFFKYRYHQPHWAIRFLPAVFPFESYRQRKMRKVSLETVLNGYGVAYKYVPESTGLVYVHLNLTSHQLPEVRLIDKQGKEHLVNLDETRFVIQFKVQELEKLLHQLLQNQNVGLAQQRLSQTLDLYLLHFQQGLFDLGVGILRNNGFISDQPIHFDVSKMTLDKRIRDPQFQKERLAILLKKVSAWLNENYPIYHDDIMLTLENKLANTFSHSLSNMQ